MLGTNRLLVPLALVLAAALLLVPLPGWWRGIWQSKLLDLSHVPLFAVITLLLWHRWRSVASAVAVAVLLAALAEPLQALVGRSPDWGDLLRGVCGAVATAGGILAWTQRRQLGIVFAGGAVALTALAWPLYDSFPYFLDSFEGVRSFPVLADFQTPREMLRWRTRQAELTRVERGNRFAGRLEFIPGEYPYPYGALRPICRDWSGYDRLCCAFSVEGQEALELVVSLRSGSGDEGGTSHFQQSRRYEPGQHLACWNLAEAVPRAEPRALDLADMWIVQFFVEEPQRRRVIHVHRVWLE